MERMTLAEETTTTGHTTAPTVTDRLPVHWELDPTTGAVSANGVHAGRVETIVPGLFRFCIATDPNDNYGMFPTPAEAAKHGAIRATLYRHGCP